jgi:hypothetical protein
MRSGDNIPLHKQILIQDCSSKKFLREGKNWTESLDDADRFNNYGEAVLKCLKLKLNGVQVLITFGQRRYDLVLPIQDSGDGSSTGDL